MKRLAYSFFFYKFIYLFWKKERQSEQVSTSRGRADREGKRGSQAGSAQSTQSLTWASNSWTVRSWRLSYSSRGLHTTSYPKMMHNPGFSFHLGQIKHSHSSFQLPPSSHCQQRESGRKGRRESSLQLLGDWSDKKTNIKLTTGTKPFWSLNHIFQAPFLRIENSKPNLRVTVNSSRCQMILSAYLYSKYKQLKMFTLSSNGSHVSKTMGGKRGKRSLQQKLEDIQYPWKIWLMSKNALFTYSI